MEGKKALPKTSKTRFLQVISTVIKIIEILEVYGIRHYTKKYKY